MRAQAIRAPTRSGPRVSSLARCPLRTGAVVMRADASEGRFVAAGMLSALIVLSSAGGAQAGEVLQGPARIVDGDTLYVQGQKVRLYAVDAPEKKQTCTNTQGISYACGERSLQALQARVGTNPVRCDVKTKDQYGRNVAACSIMDRSSEDMGTWLVSNGHAVAYRSISKDYVPAEEKAKAQHLGIWSGSFVMPAKWRYEQKLASFDDGDYPGPSAPHPTVVTAPAAAPAPSSLVTPGKSYGAAAAGAAAASGSAASGQVPPKAGCVIKGNINSKGEKIYHTPQSGAYERTIIELEKGERWFCTTQEAEAAGFRPAIR